MNGCVDCGKNYATTFGKTPRDLLNAVLDKLNLKFDRDGNRRTSYSLRHTYICLRLMEGADIYQVAKNCRTSVEMIENVLRVAYQEYAGCGCDKRSTAKTGEAIPSKAGTGRRSEGVSAAAYRQGLGRLSVVCSKLPFLDCPNAG
jgi:hypothetical protein